MPKIFSEEDYTTIRNKLLETGLEKLKSKSYKSISLDEVTAQVGIAKGTFYRFFDSKEGYFYEIMHYIKENNRLELKNLLEDENLTKEKVFNCLVHRYCEEKTVYDFFTPDEIKIIIRKLPKGDELNDSADFAKQLLRHINKENKVNSKIVVNICNILGMTAINKNILHKKEYKATVKLLVKTLTDYIFEEE